MLPFALDANRVAATLATHLLDRDSRIEECRVVRYRHRPDRRTLVQYIARVRDTHGGLSEERVTGQWHPAPEQTNAIYNRLARRVAAQSTDWRHAFAPVFRDEALGMLATTFPFDRRLPALCAVASGTAASLIASMLQYLGASETELRSVHVTPVRYREHLNAVCRYRVVAGCDGAEREAVFYAKLYAHGSGEGIVHLLQALATATAGPGQHARVQRPVAYDSGLHTLVVAAAPGESLDSLQHHDCASLERTLTRVAESLVKFARRSAPASRDAVRRAPLEGVERAVMAIAGGHPELGRVAAALREWLAATLTRRQVGLVHGDVKLEHVFVSRDDVWLIDLDSAHLGDPMWDLALLQARWWSAFDAMSTKHTTGGNGWEVLETEYLARTTLSPLGYLGPLQVAALLDVAAGVIKRREDEWRARSRRLVERARQIVQAES